MTIPAFSSTNLQGIEEIIFAIAIVIFCGFIEYRADQKKRSRK